MSDHNLAEALRLAYEALSGSTDKTLLPRAHRAVEQALAAHEAAQQAEQQAGEAVARVDFSQRGNVAWLFGPQLPDGALLFTHPQQPLTEEQIRLERKRIDPMAEDMDAWSFGQGVRFAERAHGITKDTK